LRLLAEGLSNKGIAREMQISEITVKAHVSLILKKLGVANRVQAAMEARKLLKDE
jgi:two-component system, NarL family, nitrate/nitrite response regulator NarL